MANPKNLLDDLRGWFNKIKDGLEQRDLKDYERVEMNLKNFLRTSKIRVTMKEAMPKRTR